MFTARLIVGEDFYKRRRLQLWMSVIGAILIGFLVNVFTLPDWFSVLILILFGFYLYSSLQNQRRMHASINGKVLQIGPNEISIFAKDSAHSTERFPLNDLREIIVSNIKHLPEDNLKDIGRELSGKAEKQYIILRSETGDRRFDFYPESYYMLNQLEKLILGWEKQGINIKRV